MEHFVIQPRLGLEALLRGIASDSSSLSRFLPLKDSLSFLEDSFLKTEIRKYKIKAASRNFTILAVYIWKTFCLLEVRS